METSFSQPEPRLLIQGQVLRWPVPCPPTSVTSLQQTKPVGKPASPHGFLLGSPEVPCVHVALSATLDGLLFSVAACPGVGISILAYSLPHGLHPSLASGLLPIHVPRDSLFLKTARQPLHSEASCFISPDLEPRALEGGFLIFILCVWASH